MFWAKVTYPLILEECQQSKKEIHLLQPAAEQRSWVWLTSKQERTSWPAVSLQTGVSLSQQRAKTSYKGEHEGLQLEKRLPFGGGSLGGHTKSWETWHSSVLLCPHWSCSAAGSTHPFLSEHPGLLSQKQRNSSQISGTCTLSPHHCSSDNQLWSQNNPRAVCACLMKMPNKWTRGIQKSGKASGVQTIFFLFKKFFIEFIFKMTSDGRQPRPTANILPSPSLCSLPLLLQGDLPGVCVRVCSLTLGSTLT